MKGYAHQTPLCQPLSSLYPPPLTPPLLPPVYLCVSIGGCVGGDWHGRQEPYRAAVPHPPQTARHEHGTELSTHIQVVEVGGRPHRRREEGKAAKKGRKGREDVVCLLWGAETVEGGGRERGGGGGRGVVEKGGRQHDTWSEG